jgi:beta-lactamase superfamily II metal-dependent hydrolase
LIGGGTSTSALSDALGRRLPLTGRQFDYWIVADPANEQVAALPRLLERYPPSHVLWAGPVIGGSQGLYLFAALSEGGIYPIFAESGQSLNLGQGAVLRVLNVNSRGAVLFLEWRSFRLLLPMGLHEETLARLQHTPGLVPVTAYLMARRGDAAFNPPDWIRHLNPQVVFLSVAPGDRDGLPSPETLEALQGYNLLRTDRNGWIELTTDGEQMWVEVERR